MRIFIAEGEEDLRELYQKWLSQGGHEVVFASSFLEATAQIPTFSQLDVAILDCCFSRGRHYANQGDALAAMLRERFPDVKILWVGIIERDWAFHLRKPFPKEQFLSALDPVRNAPI